jgi:hypothetical protein
MSIFNRLKSELKTAGDAARGAIDEGKVRIDIFRVRQSADAAAQALGYAVHRARKEGRELDQDTLARLDGVLAGHEAEASRLETELARHRGETPPAPKAASDEASASDSKPAPETKSTSETKSPSE